MLISSLYLGIGRATPGEMRIAVLAFMITGNNYTGAFTEAKLENNTNKIFLGACLFP